MLRFYEDNDAYNKGGQGEDGKQRDLHDEKEIIGHGDIGRSVRVIKDRNRIADYPEWRRRLAYLAVVLVAVLGSITNFDIPRNSF